MTDSFYQEDRSIDYEPDIEDWSYRGEKEDKAAQESMMKQYCEEERAQLAEAEAESKWHEATESLVKHQIQELNSLKEKLLPLLKEIKEKEGGLFWHFNSIWTEDDDWDGFIYYHCKSQEEKKALDLERCYDYEAVTPWINQHTPIATEMKQQEIENNKRLGIIDEVPF